MGMRLLISDVPHYISRSLTSLVFPAAFLFITSGQGLSPSSLHTHALCLCLFLSVSLSPPSPPFPRPLHVQLPPHHDRVTSANRLFQSALHHIFRGTWTAMSRLCQSRLWLRAVYFFHERARRPAMAGSNHSARSPRLTSFESRPACAVSSPSAIPYRGSSLTRKRTPLGPHHRPMPRVLGGF